MDQTIVAQYSLIAATLIAAVAALAAAFSDSKAACKALEGMTRQPEMAGKLFTNMLVAIGLIESIRSLLSLSLSYSYSLTHS
mgnify:CR=1 FL=1